MKKKYIAYAIVPVMALALVAGGRVASAHGWFGLGANATPEEIASRQTQMFQHKADLLGVSVDEVKNAWAQGKTLQEIAQEKGITDEQLQAKLKETKLTKMKEHLQALVNQGVITQAQADQRNSWMSTQMENGKFGHGMGKGFHHGMMW